jgi:hypothetical protein
MAVRALANIWVRIIQAMWLKQCSYLTETYLTETLVATQHTHAGRAA